MRERIECPYCGNQFIFNEHIEGLLLITHYGWDHNACRYEPKEQQHGDRDDANLFCSICDRILPPDEYDKFLEVT